MKANWPRPSVEQTCYLREQGRFPTASRVVRNLRGNFADLEFVYGVSFRLWDLITQAFTPNSHAAGHRLVVILMQEVAGA